MQKKLFQIYCLSCHKKYEFNGSIPKCCLDNSYYDDFLPIIQDEKPLKEQMGDSWISLGAGNTPLIRLQNLKKYYGGPNLYGKAEHLNPTGSFKDRETEVVTNIAKMQNIKEVAVISSGNAALSGAAHTQKAKIGCTCFIPEKTSPEKIKLIKLFGAKIQKLPGFFEDVYRQVIDNYPKLYHLTAGQNPFRELGVQKISFEIFQAIGVPDKTVVPIGNGSLLSGLYRGFEILRQEKRTDRFPQFIGVQIKNAAPVALALSSNEPYVRLENIEDSVAEGIVAKESYCSPKAVRALKNTGGLVVEVTDQELEYWQKIILQEESLLLEPTSVVVFPAMEKININKQEKIVAILTGTGLKSLHKI